MAKLEVIDKAEMPRRGWGLHRTDYDDWLAAIPANGQVLKVTLQTTKEIRAAYVALWLRRKGNKMGKDIQISRRLNSLFLWREE